MIVASLTRNTERGRSCLIESWGITEQPKPINLTTPAYLTYTRFGHIPHLTWDVVEKELAHLEQTPIYQVNAAAVFECLLSIDEVGGIKKFAAMPQDCFTHLTIHDALGRIATGFNTYKDLSVWAAKAGRKQIDATSYASIIEALKPDSYVTLSDYDTPFDTQKKRFGKCVTRTKTWNDAFFAGDNNGINRGAIATIGGGLNADTRLEIAKNYLSMPKIDAFSIELWHFSLGPNVDKKQTFEKDVVTELILPTLLSLPPNKIRLIEGAFNPSQILHLIKLGVDLVDSSYVSLLAENGKAFFIADDFETTGDFTVLDFHDACYISEKAKISDKCPCYTCKTFTKAYLRHLVDCKEMLFMVLLTIHNMTEFDRMFQRIRESLALI